MRNVELIQTIASAAVCRTAGSVEYMTDAEADELVAKGIARETDKHAPHIAQMLSRLDQGEGKPCLFLPFVGEFGHLILTHIRMVHFHRAARKVVCCREGEQVLFPDADAFDTDWVDPIDDALRAGTISDKRFAWPEIIARHRNHVPIMAGRLTSEQELYAIRPTERIPFAPQRRGLQADVVLGVRNRKFCPEKNWQHWQNIADAITAAGFTFAVIGHRSNSADLEGQECHSGDYDTDAAMELIQNAQLYVGSDTGSAHLASTIGAPMLIFRIPDPSHRNFIPRMREVNPGRVEAIDDGWTQPEKVADRIVERLKAADALTVAGR